jgi:SAM-dependent methyltransferase
VSGGLTVVVGCGDPALLAGLRRSDAFTVLALDTDPAKVAAARTALADQGLLCPVTEMTWDGKTLPFTDNLVNLVVLAGGANLPRAEIERVLAPGGALYDPKADAADRLWPPPEGVHRPRSTSPC